MDSIRSLKRSFTCEGKWWMTEDPNSVLEGVLEFIPGRCIELRTPEPFRTRYNESEVKTYSQLDQVQTIHGNIGDEKVTLLHVVNRSQLVGNIFKPQGFYRFSLALIGTHITSADETLISTISFSFSSLSKAFITDPSEGTYHWEIDENHKNNSTTGQQHSFSALNIDFDADLVTLSMKHQNVAPICDSIDHANIIVDLFSFCLNSTVSYDSVCVTGSLAPHTNCEEVDKWQGNLLFVAPAHDNCLRTNPIKTPTIQIKPEYFFEAIDTWISTSECHRVALNLFFAELRTPNHFAEPTITLYTTAFECLARSLGMDERQFEKTEFENIKRNILEDLPENYRESLSNSFQNRKTLQQKLDFLLDILREKSLLPNTFNSAKWTECLKRNRNNITHTGELKDRCPDQINHLIKTTETVLYLLIGSILLESKAFTLVSEQDISEINW